MGVGVRRQREDEGHAAGERGGRIHDVPLLLPRRLFQSLLHVLGRYLSDEVLKA